MKTVGIPGGMGPEATAELYLKIIKIFQKRYGAKYDADFPKIFICNLPLPDVVETADTGNIVRDRLIEGVKELESLNVDFIAVPCNTVSFFIDEIRKAVSIPVLSLPEEVAKIVRERKLRKVGVIGTEMTLRMNLYGKALGKVSAIVPLSDKIMEITTIIMNILSGDKTDGDRTALLKIISDLKSEGAQEVILGCTELPLLIREKAGIIDTIEVLAEEIVKRAISI